MKVLLSIKPQFANKIFEGEKKFEFRRTLFKNPEVNKVVVYSSSPVQKVIGEFEISIILSEEVNSLWEKTKEFSGIDKKFYLNYFKGKSTAHAIGIKKATLYDTAYNIKEKYGVSPPQSFLYLK